ncbi:hypothetical protein HK102_003263, partial [Quaeritorhiza haematococci]
PITDDVKASNSTGAPKRKPCFRDANGVYRSYTSNNLVAGVAPSAPIAPAYGDVAAVKPTTGNSNVAAVAPLKPAYGKKVKRSLKSRSKTVQKRSKSLSKKAKKLQK